MVTADRDLVPDDPGAYREALIDAFAAGGVYPDNVLHLSEEALVWKPLPCKLPCIEELSFRELKVRRGSGFARKPCRTRTASVRSG